MPPETNTEATPPPGPVGDATPAADTPKVETPPADTPPETADGAAKPQSFDEFLTDEGDDLDMPEGVVPPPSPPEGQEPPKGTEPPKPEEAPPKEPEVPPAEPKPAEAAPTPTPVAPAPEQPPPVVPAAAPVEQPPAPTLTMEEVRENYQKTRVDMEASVATTVYNLSEEQVQRLDDGDSQLIPELMAKVYLDAVTGAVAHIITHLPTMIESHMNGRSKDAELEDKFYAFWPTINRDEHRETVQRFGLAYRQLYPDAPLDQFIRDVGAQVIVANKIPPVEAPAGDAPPPAEPVVPAFQPARPGGGGGAPAAPVNVFDALATEMATEELDID